MSDLVSNTASRVHMLPNVLVTCDIRSDKTRFNFKSYKLIFSMLCASFNCIEVIVYTQTTGTSHIRSSHFLTNMRGPLGFRAFEAWTKT